LVAEADQCFIWPYGDRIQPDRRAGGVMRSQHPGRLDRRGRRFLANDRQPGHGFDLLGGDPAWAQKPDRVSLDAEDG
jgi:hypothetical protein